MAKRSEIEYKLAQMFIVGVPGTELAPASKEFLEDYASEDTKRVGEELIQQELLNIPKEKVRGIARSYIENIESGQRDFRF